MQNTLEQLMRKFLLLPTDGVPDPHQKQDGVA